MEEAKSTAGVAPGEDVSDASAHSRWLLSSIARVTLHDIFGECAAIALLVALLLVPALWNGFPFIYYDTGAYVFEGLGGHFLLERSPVYSLFLRFAGAGTSLWIIAVLQAATVAFVLTETARAVVPRMRLGVFLLIGFALAIGTGIPWYTGEIEPDCFTGLVALTIYPLAFHARELGYARSIVIGAIGAFAVAAHPSHLVLAGFLCAALIAAKSVCWLGRRQANPSKVRIAGPVLVCAGGLVLTLAANFHYTHKVFVSRAGASFVFARILQDKIVMRLLDDTCPKSGYTLCAWRDSLPARADAWLWTRSSPFFKLGHFKGTAAESQRIVMDSIRRYPLMQLQTAASDAIVQFTQFRTGEGIEPQQWILAPVLRYFLPAQTPAYLAARQQHGEIHFGAISRFQVAIGWLSIAALVLAFTLGLWRKQPVQVALPGVVLLALIGNAAICGVLSGPHDRYQSRLVWIAPFAALLLVEHTRMNPNQSSRESTL